MLKSMEIKCSDRYETLYTDDNDDESYNSYDSSTPSDSSTSSDEISDEISLSKNLIEKEGNEKEGQKKCN